MPDMIALRFDFAAKNLWTEVLGLTSNVPKNWRSDFLTLVFIIVTDCIGEIGLL